jgi:hypothetical protein
VALVTLLGRPLESLVSGGVGPPALLFEILVLESLARGIGWLLIARGLAELDVSTPSPTLAGLSNLVVILGGVALAAQLGGALRGGSDFGYPELGGIVVLWDLTAMGAGAAWLYLLWIAIRSFGDSRRPAIATMIAALGASITGILSSLAVLLALVVSIANSPIPLGGNLGVEDVAAALSLVAVGIGETLLVVAFALGLGDPAVPDEPPA